MDVGELAEVLKTIKMSYDIQREQVNFLNDKTK